VARSKHDQFMRDHDQHARDYQDVMRSTGQQQDPIRSTFGRISQSEWDRIFPPHTPPQDTA